MIAADIMCARVEIVRHRMGAGQIFLDQAHPFQGDALAHRMVVRGTERLKAMGKGVHARARLSGGGHANGQFRIGNHHQEQPLRVKDDRFLMGR
jgi:hypothetical protein